MKCTCNANDSTCIPYGFLIRIRYISPPQKLVMGVTLHTRSELKTEMDWLSIMGGGGGGVVPLPSSAWLIPTIKLPQNILANFSQFSKAI